VESLQHTKGRQLILTHTHAGVASIKAKLQKAKVPPKAFAIETITSYAQKQVSSYYTGNDVPPQENTREYYPFIIKAATALLNNPIPKIVVRASYAGLFVDEYQDCTLLQHQLVRTLSEILPTRILGDPLQGIFNFEGPGTMVDLEDQSHMDGFRSNLYVLQDPWRWKCYNPKLGEDLKNIRSQLEQKKTICLTDYREVQYIPIADTADLYNPSKQYYKDVSNLLKLPNLLILHPDSTSVNPRKKIVSNYKTPIRLIESIDDRTFYDLSKLFDELSHRTVQSVIYEICLQLFNKTEINKWISETGPKNRKAESKANADELRKTYTLIEIGSVFFNCSSLLRQVSRLPSVRCYRKELLQSLCGALELSASSSVPVYQAMIEKRNSVRIVGRKVFGRCIGTTLLTKGLEFDTVVLLNAHQFTCPKNLYVALTRACRQLIVFSATPDLKPNFYT
jgi:DNA helicase-2/ATP-dependent DNA helicase PcrA